MFLSGEASAGNDPWSKPWKHWDAPGADKRGTGDGSGARRVAYCVPPLPPVVGSVACCPSPARRHWHWHCRRELARKWSGVSVTRSRSYLHPAVVLRLCSADHNRARGQACMAIYRPCLNALVSCQWCAPPTGCTVRAAQELRPAHLLPSRACAGFGPRCGGNLGASPLHKSLLSVGARSGKGKEKDEEKKQSKSLAGLLGASASASASHRSLEIGPREQSDICLIGYGHLGSGKPDHAIKWLATSPLIHGNNAPIHSSRSIDASRLVN